MTLTSFSALWIHPGQQDPTQQKIAWQMVKHNEAHQIFNKPTTDRLLKNRWLSALEVAAVGGGKLEISHNLPTCKPPAMQSFLSSFGSIYAGKFEVHKSLRITRHCLNTCSWPLLLSDKQDAAAAIQEKA